MNKTLKKKFDSIDQSQISQKAVEALQQIKEATNNFKSPTATKALKDKFIQLYDKIKSNKPQAIKGLKASATKKKATASSVQQSAQAAIKKARSVRKIAEQNRSRQGISTAKDDIERDAGRPALKAGRQIGRAHV